MSTPDRLLVQEQQADAPEARKSKSSSSTPTVDQFEVNGSSIGRILGICDPHSRILKVVGNRVRAKDFFHG